MKLDIFDKSGKAQGQMEVSDLVFGLKPNPALVHTTLVWYQASRRQGNHSAKTRAEVRGGGKKPWKQKGTGRARAGSSRSPLWAGGGVIFGPKPRDYSFDLPKKARKKALALVLSDRAREGKIKIMQDLNFKAPKTAEMLSALKALKLDTEKVLVVDSSENKNALLSTRNLAKAVFVDSKNINIQDLLNASAVMITQDVVAKLEEVLKV